MMPEGRRQLLISCHSQSMRWTCAPAIEDWPEARALVAAPLGRLDVNRVERPPRAASPGARVDSALGLGKARQSVSQKPPYVEQRRFF